MSSSVNGILLLDKPLNLTSNAALQKVKRLFGLKKAGHTGSLDPLATGMLPICLGEATKFSQFLLDSNKTYYAVGQLGIQTTTGDSEGEVNFTLPVRKMCIEEISFALNQFVGEILQIPPMYAALKYKGQPLYKLARNGINVERKARKVHIYSLTIEKFIDNKLILNIHCSKGTYIRTLFEDIAKALGTCGHLVALRRLNIYPYTNNIMQSFSMLENIKDQKSLLNTLLPTDTAVQILPKMQLSQSKTFYLQRGQSIRSTEILHATFLRLYSEEDKFLGIGKVEEGKIKPYRLMMIN